MCGLGVRGRLVSHLIYVTCQPAHKYKRIAVVGYIIPARDQPLMIKGMIQAFVTCTLANPVDTFNGSAPLRRIC